MLETGLRDKPKPPDEDRAVDQPMHADLKIGDVFIAAVENTTLNLPPHGEENTTFLRRAG